MILPPPPLRLVAVLAVSSLLLAVSGCTTDPSSAASGPGVDNPTAALPGSVAPAIGGGGNGGGYSGGGAGAGSGGQGGR